MPAKFQSLNAHLPLYDDWLLIGKGDVRWIVLEQGNGLVCKSTNSRAVDIKELGPNSTLRGPKDLGFAAIYHKVRGRRIFRLTGKAEVSQATIEARAGRVRKALLRVQVGKVINVPIAFRVLRHPESDRSTKLVNHAGKWTSRAEVLDAARTANRIFGQAAINLNVQSIDFADAQNHLGPKIDLRRHRHSATKNPYPAMDFQYIQNIKPLHKNGAINVFIVNDVINHSSSEASNIVADFNILTGVARETSIFEWGETIAHECGHSFGIGAHPPATFPRSNLKKTRYLMAADLGEGAVDTGIPKQQVLTMRNSAARLKIP